MPSLLTLQPVHVVQHLPTWHNPDNRNHRTHRYRYYRLTQGTVVLVVTAVPKVAIVTIDTVVTVVLVVCTVTKRRAGGVVRVGRVETVVTMRPVVRVVWAALSSQVVLLF